MKRRNNAEEIQKRLDAWRKLTPQQQLDELDRRLGVGVGAAVQRKILRKKLKGDAK